MTETVRSVLEQALARHEMHIRELEDDCEATALRLGHLERSLASSWAAVNEIRSALMAEVAA